MLGFVIAIAPVYAQACTGFLKPSPVPGSAGNDLRLCKYADSISVVYTGPYARSGNTVKVMLDFNTPYSLEETMRCADSNCHANVKLEFIDSKDVHEVTAIVYQFEQADTHSLEFEAKF
jgi:hypothetical protein